MTPFSTVLVPTDHDKLASMGSTPARNAVMSISSLPRLLRRFLEASWSEKVLQMLISILWWRFSIPLATLLGYNSTEDCWLRGTTPNFNRRVISLSPIVSLLRASNSDCHSLGIMFCHCTEEVPLLSTIPSKRPKPVKPFRDTLRQSDQ